MTRFFGSFLHFAVARREPPRAAGSERLVSDGQPGQEAPHLGYKSGSEPVDSLSSGTKATTGNSLTACVCLSDMVYLDEFSSNKEILTLCVCV